MRKLYIYCGVVLCLISLCLVFFVVQPKLLPIETSSEDAEQATVEPTASVAEEPVASAAAEETEETQASAEAYEYPESLAEAMEQNSDIYAWIKIPGTNIDYPIIQHPTNDSYYLRRDIYGNYLSSGTILTEHTYNGTDFQDPVTIIYGHSMKSGAMFGKLQGYYSSEDGIENHKIIEIYLPDKKLEYEVFAAVPYDARHILYNYDFSNARIYSAFFKSIMSIRSFNAQVISEEAPTYDDKVLILSTCLKGDISKRYLVMAKLK